MAAISVLVASALLLFSIAQRSGSSSLPAQSTSLRQQSFVEQNFTEGPPSETLFRHQKHRSRKQFKTNQPKNQENMKFPDLSPEDYRLHIKKHSFQPKNVFESRESATTPPPTSTSAAYESYVHDFQQGKAPSTVEPLNRTRVLRRRYFDREGHYSVTRRPTTTTTKTNSNRKLHQHEALWTASRKANDQLLWTDDSSWSSEYFEAGNDKSDEEDNNYFDYTDISIPHVKAPASSPLLQSRYNEKRQSKLNQAEYASNKQKQIDSGSFKPNTKLRSGGQHKYDGIEYEPRKRNLYHEDDFDTKPGNYGSLTAHKLRTLGTDEAVEESRKTFGMHQVLAAQHISRITASLRCKLPQPKIIPVHNDKELASKTYNPHCTILHRCANDTGCCSNRKHICVPKHQEKVDLYFFVSTGSSPATIEKITFANHTECHCVQSTSTFGDGRQDPTMVSRPNRVKPCNCPKLFEMVVHEDGICRCDCSSGNVGCYWKKRGREHFSVIDRKCIIEGRCNLPICEYGHYERALGRCPRKEDKLLSLLS